MTGLVDAHHHIWRARDLPWLQGPMVPRIFGPYEPLRRDYPVEEYVADATAAGIGRAVYVQANWALDRSLDEVRWLQSVHEATGWPHAVVGCADLFSDDAPSVLDEQAAASPLVRGTRLQLHWHEDARFRFAAAPDRMHDPVFRRSIGALADRGWLFELQVFSGQMQDAERLVADFPDTTFVLVHSGMLESTADRHVDPWRDGLEPLAAHPNLHTKLTGQGTFVHRVDADLIGLVTDTTLELFGSERCMWGTNFPIESLWTDMGTLVDAWQTALAGRTEAEREDVLAGTATRVYGL